MPECESSLKLMEVGLEEFKTVALKVKLPEQIVVSFSSMVICAKNRFAANKLSINSKYFFM